MSMLAMVAFSLLFTRVFVQAPQEKGLAVFATDFLMGGVSATVSKTTAASIEHVKILIQNQDEMLKDGRLSEPYKGIGDCFTRTIKDEGFGSLWRGNTTNVICYFPTRGCDGSVLLNSTKYNKAEKDGPHNNSLHAFYVIDNAKKQVEDLCLGVAFCADILTLTAQDAVALSGGPTWDVQKGRKDGRISKATKT